MKYIYSLFLICLSFTSFSQWTEVASVPGSDRHHPVTFAIDGKGYLLTGMNAANGLMKDFYEYDPQSDQWTKKTDFPGDARGFAYGASMEGKGYIGFGINTTSYLNDLWEYDPSTDTWTELSSCSCLGRRHPAFIAFKGKIYVGLGDSGTNLRDWNIYDRSTDSWKSATDLPGIARHHPYYFHAGDHVYAGFGHSNTGIHKDWYKFDVDNETWTRMNDFPGEERVAGTQFSYDNMGYVLSGDGRTHSNLTKGEFWQYDHTTDTWRELQEHPGEGRWAPGSFVIDGKAYLIAGETGSMNLHNDMWSFDLELALSDESIAIEEPLNFYPNPANDRLNWQNMDAKFQYATYQIFDAQGRLHLSGQLNDNNSLDVSNLTPSLYILRISSLTGDQVVHQFIKE